MENFDISPKTSVHPKEKPMKHRAFQRETVQAIYFLQSTKSLHILIHISDIFESFSLGPLGKPSDYAPNLETEQNTIIINVHPLVQWTISKTLNIGYSRKGRHQNSPHAINIHHYYLSVVSDYYIALYRQPRLFCETSAEVIKLCNCFM